VAVEVRSATAPGAAALLTCGYWQVPLARHVICGKFTQLVHVPPLIPHCVGVFPGWQVGTAPATGGQQPPLQAVYSAEPQFVVHVIARVLHV
jgi:hypothetical protein